MANIIFTVLIVALFKTFSVDAQSTSGFGLYEPKGLNLADEMQSMILDEIKSLQNRVNSCSYSCSNIEDRLVRTLQSFNNARQDNRVTVTWPRNCADIRKVCQNVSGVYPVSALGPDSMPVEISVYCDMNSSSDASWLVFQRREDGSEKFERTWIEYKNGFGNLRGEFWLGNNALHLLTSNRNYKLRIELEDFDGDKRYAEYAQFSVASASDNFRISVSGYSGNAGDNMEFHNGQMFSTMDADHDSETKYSCAQEFRGGWWYSNCHTANLNGRYLRGNHTSYADGVEWKAFRGHNYSLKKVEMKIAPIN